MRKLCVWVGLASVLTAAGHAAQDDPPRFRGKVDLITIDVAAVDGSGKPIENLSAGDFTVKVDGKVRPVVSAELIKVDKAGPAAPRPADPRVSTNAVPANVRRVIMAVDQTLIPPGAVSPLLYTASKFIDRLRPEDYAAFVAFPEPGARVDFTTDKEPVRKAMQSIIGSAQMIFTGDFDISVTEAFDMAVGAEAIRNTSTIPGVAGSGLSPEGLTSTMGPAMRRVLERGCRSLTWEQLMEDPGAMAECRRDVYNEALRVSSMSRVDTDVSLRALEQILQGLVPLEGPKTLVLFSAGLVNDNPTLLEPLARLAAAARTTINVVYADLLPDQQTHMPYRASTVRFIDRSMERAGLEIVADRTGGTLYRGIASGAGIFQRIESEMSGWYLVAVERQPGDPERQRVEVAVKRKGVNVRSNRTFVSEAPKAVLAMDQVLNDALSSPFSIPGLPLKVSTFTQRDGGLDKYRVRVAAEIGQPGEPGGEFAVGYVLTTELGRPQKTAGSRRSLSPPDGAPNEPLFYDTVFTADPGIYLLRFAVVDKEGRRGTVVRRLELPPIRREAVATSDLIVGNMPTSEGETLRPGVEPRVTAGALAGYLELYVSDRDRDRVTVNLEIAEGEESPALVSKPLTLRDGEQPSARVATGFIETTMAPGRYLARATVRRDGEVVRTVSHPFTLVRNQSAVVATGPRVSGAPVSPDIQRRTANYVSGFVGGLGNVVAQEDFVLSKRRVTSELLLVRYPGSQRDLIPYRDVALLNGAPLAGRDERLLDLFVNSTERVRDRARKIMLAADSHVPSMFNPMFVIGFLQSDFQSRFELTMADAGPEWPAGVKAVNFIETSRPTLLRTGPFGDVDVPSRGTAWIEESTGRILQTELQLGSGRQAPSMVTKFKLDDRLQIIVPETMRTQNPEGAAIYTNFRRFTVASDATIPAPAPTPAPPQQ